MKKIIIFVFLLSSTAFGQMRDLEKLAKGDVVRFHAIFDTEADLYGYFVLYSQGMINEDEKSFEYVILDKNLNRVANSTFTSTKYALSYKAYINFKGELVLKPKVDLKKIGSFNLGQFTYPDVLKIDTESNTIERKSYLCFENQNFVECPESKEYRELKRDYKKERKIKGFVDNTFVIEVETGGYLVFEEEEYKKFTKNESLSYFNENKERLWEFEFNQNGSKNHQEYFKILDTDENYVYTKKTIIDKGNYSFYFAVFDLKTGNIVQQFQLTGGPDEAYRLLSSGYSRDFENKKIFISHNNFYSNKGYIKWIVDKSNLSIKPQFFHWGLLKEYLPKINQYGKVEKAYYLEERDIFIMEDETVNMLFEKVSYLNGIRNTDLVLVKMDNNFVVTSVQVIEKEKSKNSYSDYLFSQKLNDGKDVVFFYKDYVKDDETKKKNWNLFINTLINGEFTQERILISSEENYVVPYVAKEGYILLQEHNEKGKYNQIRLEKLNF